MSEKKLVSPTGRIVFHKNLYTPTVKKGKYEASLVFDKSQDLSELKNLLMEAARSKFKEEDIKSKKFSLGMKTPDEEACVKYEFLDANKMILNAGTKFEVEVLSNVKGSDGKYDPMLEDDLKAGDYCRFLLSAYPWEFEGKKGASFNLLAVQFVKKGEAFYSRISSDSVFDSVDFDIEVEEVDSSSDAEDMEW